jgi:hypothetical protein
VNPEFRTERAFDEDDEQLCAIATCDAIGRLTCPFCDALVCCNHDGYDHDFECGAWMERQAKESKCKRNS